MKKILLIIVAIIGSVCGVAELNYRSALQDARNSEGTDSAICEALAAHGFNKDWSDTITFGDKLNALFAGIK